MSASTRADRRRDPGFTLIELLVVMSIIVLLCGMLMPLMGLAKRSSMRTATLAIMGKTEAALYQFKADYRGYPYQLSYAADGQPWTNALAYHLGTDIALADQLAVKADMRAAAANYGYALNNGSPQPASVQTFTENRHSQFQSNDGYGSPESDVAPAYAVQQPNNGPWYWVYPPLIPTCVLLNRLGTERANEAMLIGDVTAGGVVMPEILSGAQGNFTHHIRDLSSTRLVAAPQSAGRPGWAKDYLQGQIDARHLRDDTVLDAYFHPLIYICQVVPGCDSAFGHILNCPVDIGDSARYGLQPLGRRTLQPFVPGTNVPITAEPATLPDAGNLMHSDMRFWAPPGYELEFELWSAGPDGRTSWWRDDPANRDNLPCEPYNKSIGRAP